MITNMNMKQNGFYLYLLTIKYKQPYRLVQNIYYKKEDKIDDLNYKKFGDWVVKEYGNTRKDYYTSRYKV